MLRIVSCHTSTQQQCFLKTVKLSSTKVMIEELLVWMQDQAEVSFYQVKGEITDNANQHIVKQFQYSPPEER